MITKKRNIDIHIEANMGSDWQLEIWDQLLWMMVKGWALQVVRSHKKNKVFINGAEVDDD